ncbi:hypothetical protein F5B19DRAFT_298072 [Rostrohypoxylon terebratum]|nr:hypothetical protein F5B19DRAFT_298072 [Rostrohypoxylon terebratum]
MRILGHVKRCKHVTLNKGLSKPRGISRIRDMLLFVLLALFVFNVNYYVVHSADRTLIIEVWTLGLLDLSRIGWGLGLAITFSCYTKRLVQYIVDLVLHVVSIEAAKVHGSWFNVVDSLHFDRSGVAKISWHYV